MTKVVSNTSPLIAFTNLGKLHLLKDLFGRMTIPLGVYEELKEGFFRLEEWIEVVELKARDSYRLLRAELDHGESEAISLYTERRMDLLLVDDKEARKVAEGMQIAIAGTGGVLLMAKRKGLIGSVRAELELLDREGTFWMSTVLKDRLLREAGE